MTTHHATLGDYQFHYDFDGVAESLSIVVPDGTGGLVFGWRTDLAACVLRVTEDARYGVGTSSVSSLGEFPLAAVVAVVQDDRAVIAAKDRKRILGILRPLLPPAA